jgi:hypothetical protein
MLHPLRDFISFSLSLQLVLLFFPFNFDSHKFFSFLSIQGVCFVIIFAVELEELRELWLIGAEMMEG